MKHGSTFVEQQKLNDVEPCIIRLKDIHELSCLKLSNVLRKKARFKDESEAELIREKFERFVDNILEEVEKRSRRFRNCL